jgi:hypothetical protein
MRMINVKSNLSQLLLCYLIDNVVHIWYSSDSSSSEESIHSLSQWFPKTNYSREATALEESHPMRPLPPKTDNNGLVFAPECDGPCFPNYRQAKCNHSHHSVSLNKVGEYVAFPSMWYHHGYFSVKPKKTVIQAQLFAIHSPDPAKERLTRNATKMDTYVAGKVVRTCLDELTKDLVGNWNTKYSEDLFPVCTLFNGEWVERDKTRHILSSQFDSVPRIRELVQMFEEKFPHLRIDSLWLLTKSSSNDGFQNWHRDFALGTKITTTTVVNVGSYNSSS